MKQLQQPIATIARLLAVFTLVSTAAAQQPIPAGPDASTRKDYVEAEYAFHTRTICDAYGQVGSRHDRWDALAERFLFLMTDFLAGRPGALTRAQLATAAKAAIDAGCDDPMVLYWYGHCLRRTGRNQEAEAALRRAYESFVPSGYSVAYRCWAGGHLGLALRELGKQEQARQLDDQVLELYIATITSGTYRPDEQRILLEHIRWKLDQGPIDQVQKLQDAVVGKPGTDPWTALMIAGRLHLRLAWPGTNARVRRGVT